VPDRLQRVAPHSSQLATPLPPGAATAGFWLAPHAAWGSGPDRAAQSPARDCSTDSPRPVANAADPVRILSPSDTRHLLDLRKPPGCELGLTLVNRDSRIGCVISHVLPGGVGELAGLGVGDVVLAVDGRIYSETVAMSNAIFAASGVVSFEVAGAMPSRQVRIGRLPLCLTLRSTSCRVGVLITDVTAGGPAANAGLTVGDLILSVNGSPIETAEKGLRALNERGAAPCLLVVAGALVEVDTPCTC